MTYLKHGSRTKKPKEANEGKQSRNADAYADESPRHSRCLEEAVDNFASIFSTYVSNARDGQHDGNGYTGLSEIATQLEAISNAVRGYNLNSMEGENSLDLFTGKHSPPMRLVLEGTAVNSIADSLKRIADAMTAARAEGGGQKS